MNRVLSNTLSSSGSSAERLAADFQTFVGDVEQALRSASVLPGDGMAAARTKLEEKVSQARLRLADAGSAAWQVAGRARDASEDYVRARPWTVLGVAVAIGALAAFLLSRRE